MTTQTKMYDLSEMLNLYETTVQSTFHIHGTRKDALRLARQAIQQQYPDIKNTNLGSNTLVARFWKQTQTIIRKYYPRVVPNALPLQSTSDVPNASDVRAHSVVPNAMRPDAMRPDAVPNASVVPNAVSFERRFLSWIDQNDFVPFNSCLMAFTGLENDVISKAFRSAYEQGYDFHRTAFGFRVTKRPDPINTQVDELKAQFTALISRLEKLTGNSNLVQ